MLVESRGNHINILVFSFCAYRKSLHHGQFRTGAQRHCTIHVKLESLMELGLEQQVRLMLWKKDMGPRWDYFSDSKKVITNFSNNLIPLT